MKHAPYCSKFQNRISECCENTVTKIKGGCGAQAGGRLPFLVSQVALLNAREFIDKYSKYMLSPTKVNVVLAGRKHHNPQLALKMFRHHAVTR